MSKLSITIKAGPGSTRDKVTFDNTSNPATRKAALSKLLTEAIQEAADAPAQDKFLKQLEDVQAFIRQDLETFARHALQFFFHQESSTNPETPLRLKFNDYSPNATSGLGFKSAFSPSRSTIRRWL